MVDNDSQSNSDSVLSKIDRRRFLRGTGAASAIALAGCIGGDGGGNDTTTSENTPTTNENTPTTAESTTNAETTTGAEAGTTSESGAGEATTTTGNDTGNNTSGNGTTMVGGTTSSDVVDLQVWELFGGGDGKAFKKLLGNFNDAHDGIQIHDQGTDWNDYYGKLYTAMSGNNAPDIAIVHVTRLLKFAPGLVDLSDRISSDTKSAYVDKIWKKTNVDGKRASLPLDTHPCGLYYNKDLFKKAGLDPSSPPSNWKEFKNAADTISSETDAHGFVAQSYGGPTILRTWFALLEQKGGQLLNEDKTKAAFNSDVGLDTMKTFQNMTGKWSWDKADTSDNRGDKAFRSSKAGMSYQGTWYVNSLKDADFDWGMTKPFFAEGLKDKLTWANSHSLAIPKRKGRSDEKTKAAVTAIEWITQNSTVWGKIAGHLPADKKVLNSDAMQNSQWWDVTLKQFMEMANNNQIDYLPRTQKQSEYKRPIFKNVQQVYSQNKKPQQALDDMEKRINSILG